ncbi:hypothetical protein [Ktedonobacter racemifer]|uniref:Uncharacterized protein n=1 Tax=Ktedonobacter racemifer DSM 44963 TaxID=485913 RepID=D6TX28_KTERA|nr:hypothetical protein [Ktedonobacter racemifer]EFH84761.1 conserved hypothetical protein [Ktedonobacter racemifer DSM 44963]
MDPVSTIEAALVAGAALSAKDTASQAVKDGYALLKTQLNRLVAGKPKARVILEEHEEDPKTYTEPLKKILREVHAGQDEAVMEAAKQILAAAQQQQIGMGKFNIQNNGNVYGQNIGDHQTITQHFEESPNKA